MRTHRKSIVIKKSQLYINRKTDSNIFDVGASLNQKKRGYNSQDDLSRGGEKRAFMDIIILIILCMETISRFLCTLHCLLGIYINIDAVLFSISIHLT